MVETKQDIFWLYDYSILYHKDRLVEFVPTNLMTLIEKLNAIVRLSWYLGLLMALVYKNGNFLLMGFAGMAISYFLYQNTTQKGGNGNDLGWSAVSDDSLPTLHDDNGFKYQPPSEHNPFMNVLLTDYVDNPTRVPAGDVQDPKVREGMEKHFNHNLYRDASDIWGKNNSQRQYYSNPSTTIPNDQHAFMHWCWDVPYVCKDGDMSACLHTSTARGT